VADQQTAAIERGGIRTERWPASENDFGRIKIIPDPADGRPVTMSTDRARELMRQIAYLLHLTEVRDG